MPPAPPRSSSDSAGNPSDTMPCSIVVFVHRKPDTTVAEFRDYAVNHHIPLIKEVTGEHMAISHTIHFPARVESRAGDRLGLSHLSSKKADPETPVVFLGKPEDFTWDAMAVIKFRDELHFQQYFARINDPAYADRMQEDEEKFSDMKQLKGVIVGESVTFTPDD